MVGYLEGIRDCRCVATLDVEDQVGAETGMQHRGVVIEAAPCFNNRRKNLVVDVNRLGGVERRSEERRGGKSVSVRVDLGGRRIIKKKNRNKCISTTNAHN